MRTTLWTLVTSVTLGTVVACRAERAISMGDVSVASTSTGVGTTPAVALASAGHRAISWVSAPNGGTDARIYVSIDGALPVAISDSLGVVQAHVEAPPQLAFDRQGTLYLLYVVVRDAGGRFPLSALRLVRSTDNGVSWDPPVTVTDDSVALGAHNFQSLAVSPDGIVYASWLDGRDGAMAAYLAASSDHGRTWSRNVQLSVGETCPCCHTSIVAGPAGVVYAAWRAVFPGNVRDIVVARSADRGVTWNAPVRVHADNWVYPGCPHAGPSIQLDNAQRLHVLWWTGAPGHAGVFYASSRDDGTTFSTPIAIAPQRIPMPTHVQLGVDIDNDMIAAWDDPAPMATVVTVRLSKDGGMSFGHPFAISDSSHQAHHPALTVNDNAAFIAWTQADGMPAIHQHQMESATEPMKMGIPKVGTSQVVIRDIRF